MRNRISDHLRRTYTLVGIVGGESYPVMLGTFTTGKGLYTDDIDALSSAIDLGYRLTQYKSLMIGATGPNIPQVNRLLNALKKPVWDMVRS